jgi:hypothetical protein
MKKIALLLLVCILSSCKVFNPHGSWITQEAKNTYQIKKAPDNDIKIRQIGTSNNAYNFYSKTNVDSVVIFQKRTNNSRGKILIETPEKVEFITQDRAIFSEGTNEDLAFRISKKEEPSEDVLNAAIARELDKRYPITVRNWNSGRINGNSHRFEKVLVRFSKTGVLTVNGTQTVNECRGFTGRVFVYLKDFKGNILAEGYLSPNGLDPKFPCRKNKRSYDHSVKFKNKLNQQELKELIVGTYQLEIRAERTGSPGRIEKNIENLKKVTSDLKEIGADIAEIYALFSGVPVN